MADQKRTTHVEGVTQTVFFMDSLLDQYALLPTNMYVDMLGDYDGKETLEAAGVEFRDLLEEDGTLQHVKLPKGWRIVLGDYPTWSSLVDDRDRVRARIMVKIEYYQRSDFTERQARMVIHCRFNVALDGKRYDEEGVVVYNVYDRQCDGEVIYATEPRSIAGVNNPDDRCKLQDDADKEAIAWLDIRYPEWHDPKAYWD